MSPPTVTAAVPADVPADRQKPFAPRLRIGLTGGSASGKSAVGAALADLGAVLIDYDRLAREAVEPGAPAHEGLVERVGSDTIRPDGRHDGTAPRGIVFDDGDAARDPEEVAPPQ